MAGMAMVINPSMDNNAATYAQKAVAMNKALAPANGLVAQQAVMQSAAGQTLTISVAGAAAATGAAGSGSNPTVASGSGQSGTGSTCTCQCLCGVNAFPQNVGQGMFGGFLGE